MSTQAPFVQKNNGGSMFANDRKTTDKHPDHKGKALIDGQWFWVSAWDKQGQKGPWLSLSFEPMTTAQVDQYCGGSIPQAAPERQAPARQPQQVAPGYAGPPQGQAKANAAARKAGQPMPAVVPDLPFDDGAQFGPDDVPFAWAGRSTMPL